MQDTYIEYVLSQCHYDYLHMVCSVYSSIEEFKNAALSEFYGLKISGQGYIINSISDCLQENRLFRRTELGIDANKLYSRSKSSIDRMKSLNDQRKNVDFEDLFNVLTDFNWLIASLYDHDRRKSVDTIELIENQSCIHIYLRHGLKLYFYDESISQINLSSQYESAKSFKYRAGLECHPNSRVRRMLERGCSDADLEDEENCAIWRGRNCMAAFNALTATALLSENIRRHPYE